MSRFKTRTWLYLAAVLSVVFGLFYLFGPLRHPFAGLWGLTATAGGAAGLVLAPFLPQKPQPGRSKKAPGAPRPLVIGAAVLSLHALAQLPPLVLWGAVLTGSLARPVNATPLLPLLGHLVLLAVSAAGVVEVARLLPAGQRAARDYALYGGALLAGLAAPAVYVLLQNATWLVEANPAPGETVALHSEFTYTWPGWQGRGVDADIRYEDGTPVPHVVQTDAGRITLYPDLLLPHRQVRVRIAGSGFRTRTFTYQTAPTANSDVDLYRTVLSHWFRAPQGGETFRGFVALDPNRMDGLSPDQKHLVVGGLTPYTLLAGLYDPETERVIFSDGTEIGNPGDPLLLLSLEVQDRDKPSPTVTLRAERRKIGSDAVEWQTEVTYRAVKRDGGWSLEKQAGSEEGRPWGES